MDVINKMPWVCLKVADTPDDAVGLPQQDAVGLPEDRTHDYHGTYHLVGGWDLFDFPIFGIS